MSERLEEAIFGDRAFIEGDPKFRAEAARVRLYQQVGILLDSPAAKAESQGEIVRFTIDKLQECVDAFVASNSSPSQG